MAIKLAIPAIERLRDTALRCELIEAEPETALPALALGDVDLVLGDEWQHQPWRIPAGLTRHHLFDDPVLLVGSDQPLETLADHVWTSGHAGMAWDEMIQRTCREHGGFEPDIRHRTNDANVSLALVARGLAVTLLPQLAIPPGFTTRPVPVSPRDPRRHPRHRRHPPLDATPCSRRSVKDVTSGASAPARTCSA